MSEEEAYKKHALCVHIFFFVVPILLFLEEIKHYLVILS